MATVIDTEAYRSWFSVLFGTPSVERVLSVSLAVSLAVFVLGYGIAILGGVTYPRAPVFVGVFAVFAMTAALGIADATYPNVWNEVREAFAVDDETYRAVVAPSLERMHDDTRIVLYATVLAVPYCYLTLVTYLPLEGWPLRTAAVEIFFGGTLSYESGVGTVVLVWVFGAVSAVLVATIVNGFLEHLALVRAVAELPFRDVYAAATNLAPVARFTAASATAWFAGSTLVVLWMEYGIGEAVGTTFIAILALTGLVFFVAPQLLLHDALVEAKQVELRSIRREYHSMLDASQSGDVAPQTLGHRLELTDRRLETAQAIDTWVYNLSSISKLAAAAVIPWVTLLRDLHAVLGF